MIKFYTDFNNNNYEEGEEEEMVKIMEAIWP